MKNVRINAEWTRQGDQIKCKVTEVYFDGINAGCITKGILSTDLIDIDPIIGENMDEKAAENVAKEYYKEYNVVSFTIL